MYVISVYTPRPADGDTTVETEEKLVFSFSNILQWRPPGG